MACMAAKSACNGVSTFSPLRHYWRIGWQLSKPHAFAWLRNCANGVAAAIGYRETGFPAVAHSLQYTG